MKTNTLTPVVQGGRKCKFCGEPMGDARENKEYCGNSCRAKQRRQLVAEQERENAIRLKLLESMQPLGAPPLEPMEGQESHVVEIDPEEVARIEGIMLEIGKQEQQLAANEEEIAKVFAEVEAELAKLPAEIAATDKEILRLTGFQKLNHLDFYNRFMNKALADLQARVNAGNLPMDYIDLGYQESLAKALVHRMDKGSELWNMTQQGFSRLAEMIAKKQEERKKLVSRLETARNAKTKPPILIYAHQIGVDQAKRKLVELRRKLAETPPPKPPKPVAPVLPVAVLNGPPSQGIETGLVVARPQAALVPSQQPEQRKPKVPKGEIGGADLLAESSESFLLQGALGAFVGRLDRKMVAIGLTGDSGSGKSTFSLRLALRFARHGFSVKYFSLEEGLGDSMKRKIWEAEIGNEVKFQEGATLQAIKQDAKRFDVIFIDSFTVLEGGQDELEKLRKDFPETIFVCIHQKTTAGTIRGGSKIFYNSTAIINIEIDHDRGRLAVMQKSRYGTVGFMYNIGDDEVFRAGDW